MNNFHTLNFIAALQVAKKCYCTTSSQCQTSLKKELKIHDCLHVQTFNDRIEIKSSGCNVVKVFADQNDAFMFFSLKEN